MFVVETFEVIDIDDQQRQWATLTTGEIDLARQGHVHRPTVSGSGQRVP
jgi:hypothetical protein